MEAVVCRTEQVPPKATRKTSETKCEIVYTENIDRFIFDGLVKIGQFTKFSPSPIFVLIW